MEDIIYARSITGHSFNKFLLMSAFLLSILHSGSIEGMHISVVWVGIDGDEIVCAHLGSWKKVKNIQKDDRVSLSIETGGKTGLLENYLVLSGRARITEGGAPELLRQLAQVYLGPGSDFPPSNSPPGYLTHIQVEHVHGHGPWRSDA